MFALHARYLLPISSPPLCDASVLIEDGRIVDVRQGRFPVETVELGNAALLPGLVNAHTHLEFSLLTSPLPAPDRRLSGWITEVVQWRRRLDADPHGSGNWRSRAIRAGIEESLRSGVTTIADIASPPVDSRSYSGRVRTTAFLEFLGLSKPRAEEQERRVREQINAARLFRSPVRYGISPHSPYTVRWESLRSLCDLSARTALPIAMHLAESPEEVHFLRSRSGTLRELLDRFGAWDEEAIPAGVTTRDYLRELAASARALVIHGAYLSSDELEFLSERPDHMSVVYCARTHDYFGHAPYPLERMLDNGVTVALGTDSRASTPDLDLLADMRRIARKHPLVPREQIVRMGTLGGAKALGMAEELGSLAPGRRADVIAIRLPPGAAHDPYGFLDEDRSSVSHVYQSGELVFTDGSC